MDRIKLRESIERNVSLNFSRSGGSGGQNVNKVNTKVRAGVPLAALEGLNEAERKILLQRAAGRISDGTIAVSASDERTQEANRRIALERLEQVIAEGCKILPKRHKTKPTRASKERRLAGKRLRSRIKALRRGEF